MRLSVSEVRRVAKAVTPPIVWAAVKRLKGAPAPTAGQRQRPEWEYVPQGWTRSVGGWDSGAVAASYREKWPSFLTAVAGPGPLGVNHEVRRGVQVSREDRDAQHMVLAFGYALALAAGGREHFSLLDWGGGPGHYAVLARALLPGLELEYHSRDMPALVALGRELLPGDSFHADDACLGRTYNFVVASSSLQYSEDWRSQLIRLAGATGDYLYLTRVPIALRSASFVVLQRAAAYGYETEYLGWVLNRQELLDTGQSAGLELVREVVLPGRFSAEGAPEAPVEHRGYLFKRPSALTPHPTNA